jgi:selenocysteine-specific elongation factor
MRHCILGTAGHIDHGKSSLVHALTGVNPDRLPEEQARGMTIVLGFAPLQIGGTTFGVVDVPGHERFVKTMVSGATGIDVALLVVAADDGVMPQTVEHAEILDLLGVRRAVVAINKADLVHAQRIDDVRGQVRDLIATLAFADAPIVAVSARTGDGLNALRAELARAAGDIDANEVDSVFRLAIDRVFTVKGRGTVVTGSVLSGAVQAGASVELLPQRVTCRVRELQSHDASADALAAGQRAALNLVGVEKADIAPGCELASPGFLAPSKYVDARIRVLARGAAPLKSHVRVRLAIGTAERIAAVVTRDHRPIAPGQTADVQLRLREPHVAAHGQRFILRDETASRTIGGGVVLCPVARRWVGREVPDGSVFDALASHDAGARIEAAMRLAGFDAVDQRALSSRAGVPLKDVAGHVESLVAAGLLVRLPGSADPVHAGVVKDLADRTGRRLKRVHERQPADAGMPADALTTWLTRRSAKGLGRLLLERFEKDGLLSRRGAYVAHAEFRPAMSEQDQRLYDTMLAELAAGGCSPPAIEEMRCADRANVQRLRRLVELAKSRGQVVQVDASIVLHAERFAALKERVRSFITEHGPSTLSEIRQALETTRKYAVPIMEYLDRAGVTRRTGDKRTLA